MDILLVDKKMTFSGAKNSGFYIHKNQLNILKASIFPIGGSKAQYRDRKIFENIEIDYVSGDICYLFSDGFQDQFGGSKDTKYMKKRFRKFVHNISPLSLDIQKDILEGEFNTWKGQKKQTDDVLVLGLKLI